MDKNTIQFALAITAGLGSIFVPLAFLAYRAQTLTYEMRMEFIEKWDGKSSVTFTNLNELVGGNKP